jgi:hypothetical protein
VDWAQADPRVPAAAEVGSRALGGGDRWSDLDLTFAVSPPARVADVLADWSARFEREFQAAALFDLPFRSTIFRVFLLPGTLQVDLSFTPAPEFGPYGPGFRLLFGEAVEREPAPSTSAVHSFGFAVHHAARARIAIERDRPWLAEYWISGMRDETLGLACLARGYEPRYARGADRLDAELKAAFEPALVRGLGRAELLRAFTAAVGLLIAHGAPAGDLATRAVPRLRELLRPDWAAPRA